jgi:hypothetical protein
VSQAPKRFMAGGGTLLHPFGSARGTSKASLVTGIGSTDSSRPPIAPPCFNRIGRRRIELAREELLGG